MAELTQSHPSGFWRRLGFVCQGLTARDRRNSRRANWRLLAWVATFLGVAFGLRGGVIPAGPWAYLAIALSTALGVWAVMGYVRFIREADELLRKIQLEALAMGFGAALVASFTLTLLEKAGAYTVDSGDQLLVMVAGYTLGVLAGLRRYS